VGGDTADPLLLGQRVVTILETGQRDATYKLATLMALIEHCIENLPDRSDDVLEVLIPDLAHRVLAIYWQQVRPFEGHDLLQRRSGTKSRIIDATKELRAAADVGDRSTSLDVAITRHPHAYQRAIDKIVIALAKQPLPRLQKLPGSSVSDPFLYDDSFLGENVSRSALRSRGNTITLKAGVAHGLARLAGLLKPALEIMWVEDVRQMNKFLNEEVPNVAGHLFGRERVDLAPVRELFKKEFGEHCFYCQSHLSVNNPVDHVLPWSLVGIDGLANLVLACDRCNGDKSNALPAVSIVSRVLARDQGALDRIASQIQWPVQRKRVVHAARGIYGMYRGQPTGVPTWLGYKQSERLDISFLPRWVE
jgi:5-methylcytosine-specific restriction endonuclease McrA